MKMMMRKRDRMSSPLKKHIRKAPLCHRCNAERKGKTYLTYKDGYGWVCERCGYQRPVKDWQEGAVK